MSEIEDGYELTLAQYSEDIYKIEPIQPYKSSILSAPPRVYDAMERMPIDGESGQGLPDNKSVSNTIINNIATRTPGYRGAYTSVGTVNEEGRGVIDENKMSVNDWVAYIGVEPNSAGWLAGYCYRWTIDGWKRIEMNETAPYMAALADLTRDAGIGKFSTVFTQRLMAMQATIQSLEAEVLRFRNPKNRNEYIELSGIQGYMKSSNFTNNNDQGFMINYNGNAEFRNGIFKGKIIGNEAEFTGNLKAMISLFGRGINRRLYGGVRAFCHIVSIPQPDHERFSFDDEFTTNNVVSARRLGLGRFSVKIDDTEANLFIPTGVMYNSDYNSSVGYNVLYCGMGGNDEFLFETRNVSGALTDGATGRIDLNYIFISWLA